jgi:hypothetical protein
MQQGLLPKGQRLTSAERFCRELEGENEVFEDLGEDMIVSLVKPQAIDKSDSGRSRAYEACKIASSQAVLYARQTLK